MSDFIKNNVNDLSNEEEWTKKKSKIRSYPDDDENFANNTNSKKKKIEHKTSAISSYIISGSI